MDNKEHLLILKDGRGLVCEYEEADTGFGENMIMCAKLMLISWSQDKAGRLLLHLSPFPAFANVLVSDWENARLPIEPSQVWGFYSEAQMSDLLLAAYRAKKRELFGGVDIVSALPPSLKGRA